MTPRRAAIWSLAGLGLLFIAVQGFVWHSIGRGIAALSGDAALVLERLAGSALSNTAISLHMVAGGVVTALAVLQWAGPVRRRWPQVHRVSGRVLAALALVTGIAGLVYIAQRGTIGGAEMNIGFALYGALMIWAAIMTPVLAMRGDYTRHRRWALRLIVLCIGSWLYRLHYGLLYGISCTVGPEHCGIWTVPEDFSGPFDRVQNFAFYLPYLALVQLWLWRERQPEVE